MVIVAIWMSRAKRLPVFGVVDVSTRRSRGLVSAGLRVTPTHRIRMVMFVEQILWLRKLQNRATILITVGLCSQNIVLEYARTCSASVNCPISGLPLSSRLCMFAMLQSRVSISIRVHMKRQKRISGFDRRLCALLLTRGTLERN